MKRAIDLCTCGGARADHGNATHAFMPHPQPPAEPVKTFADKVADLVKASGSCYQPDEDGPMFVQLLDGSTYEVQVTLRVPPKNDLNSGGV